MHVCNLQFNSLSNHLFGRPLRYRAQSRRAGGTAAESRFCSDGVFRCMAPGHVHCARTGPCPERPAHQRQHGPFRRVVHGQGPAHSEGPHDSDGVTRLRLAGLRRGGPGRRPHARHTGRHVAPLRVRDRPGQRPRLRRAFRAARGGPRP
jgi:hypothetical protein